MGNRKLLLAVVVVSGFVCFCGAALAEEGFGSPSEPVFAMSPGEEEIVPPGEPGFPLMDEPPAPMKERRGDKGKKEDVRELVKALYIWKITQALELTEEQSVKLIPRLSLIDKKKQDISGKVRELTGKLRDGLNREETSEDALKETIAEILKLRAEQRELELQGEKIAQEVLTVEQQAKFIVFLQDFQKQIHRLIRQTKDLRERQGDRRGPPPPRESERRFTPPPEPEDFPPEPEY
jgi:hypothetical protein